MAGQHGVPLVLVALVDAIRQRIAVEAYEQAEDYLRVVVTAFLGEPRPAQFVLIVGLEVKRRHVVEHHTDVAAVQLHGVAHADLLHNLMLAVAELVQVAVNLRQIHVVIKVVLQIFHCRSLTRGVRQTSLDQLAKNLIFYPVEAHTVKHAVEYQVCPVEQHIAHLRENAARFLYLALVSLTLLSEQVQPRLAAVLLTDYPQLGLMHQSIYLFIIV